MSRILRRILSTACGLLCVGTLLYVAIRFPEYYCAYTDKDTLNNMVTTDIKIQTYETAYTSFAEKIHALTQARDSGNMLSAVRMNETEINPSRKEMTKIVREEFKKMKENQLILTAYKPKAKNMKLCERYTIYVASEQDSMKGISCWKVEYKSKKRNITLYLDEEYHKIYYFQLVQKMGQTDDGKSAVYDVTDSVSSASEIDPYVWWDGVMHYYDLITYQGFLNGGIEDYSYKFKYGALIGSIGFEDIDASLEIYRNIKYGYESNSLVMGLLLEKMIQF
ncbi:MAG: hypothetical protein K2K70_01945 [Lachnospiraceae bacterium]|nr:hypothetical protein [Lachnospiraceae bacterium]